MKSLKSLKLPASLLTISRTLYQLASLGILHNAIDAQGACEIGVCEIGVCEIGAPEKNCNCIFWQQTSIKADRLGWDHVLLVDCQYHAFEWVV